MIFRETDLAGAYVIEIEKMGDSRGFFARAWCQREFATHGLVSSFVQCNVSHNKHRNTLRGMHYQAEPFGEVKLVRCTRGIIFDVMIDLRADSETYLKWVGIELTSENYRMLYVPKGFAHGYLSLTDNAEIFYQVSQFYSPAHERGVRWNDQAFGIDWPNKKDIVISEKDSNWPDFQIVKSKKG
jgi:dTDP-4-dehydrorhamnose 3,5-epimerase